MTCAPEFVWKIHELAILYKTSEDEMHKRWRVYALQCEWGDQSPLLWEFENGLQEKATRTTQEAA